MNTDVAISAIPALVGLAMVLVVQIALQLTPAYALILIVAIGTPAGYLCGRIWDSRRFIKRKEKCTEGEV